MNTNLHVHKIRQTNQLGDRGNEDHTDERSKRFEEIR